MNYRDRFSQLIEENKLEEARLLLEQNKIFFNDDAFYYANMGWVLNQLERYNEAEIYLRSGIYYFPDDPWLYAQLGYCLNRKGSIEDGVEMLLMAIMMGCDDSWIHGEIAWSYKETGQYDQAIIYFENALMEDPCNTWLISQAADAYMLNGDRKNAEEYFLKSYYINTDDDARIDLANLYRACREYDKEIQYLLEIENDSFVPWKYYELGYACNRLQRFEEAYQYLKSAYLCGMQDTSTLCELGDTCMHMKRIEEAANYYEIAATKFEEALKSQENTYLIYQELVWIAHQQNKLQDKLEYLKKAICKYPDDCWFMYHLAKTCSDLGEYVSASEACKFCMEHDFEKEEMMDLCAWNMGRAGKTNEAIVLLNERVEQYGADDWVYSELGWNYTQLKDYEKAEHYFRKAHDNNQENSYHVSMLGWVELRLQRFEDALAHVNMAIELGRNDGWIHAVKGELLQNMDYLKEAVIEYQMAQQLGYEDEWIQEEIAKLNCISSSE